MRVLVVEKVLLGPTSTNAGCTLEEIRSQFVFRESLGKYALPLQEIFKPKTKKGSAMGSSVKELLLDAKTHPWIKDIQIDMVICYIHMYTDTHRIT